MERRRYLRHELLDAERVQDGGQRRQRVAQRQVDARVVEREGQAHLLAGREPAQGDGGARLRVVGALGDEVVTLRQRQRGRRSYTLS